MLDSLNSSTNIVLSNEGNTKSKNNNNSIEERQLMKRFARPTNQIKGMISMINSVAADLKIDSQFE